MAYLLSMLVGSGCDAGAGSPRGASSSIFTDSRTPVWELSATPVLELGGTDERDGYAFGRVVGAVVLSDGLAIADSRFAEVRFYTLTGELEGRFGRKGSAPGEYRSLSALALVDDSTLVAWDDASYRLTLLTRSGRVRETVSLATSGQYPGALVFAGVLEGGRYAFRTAPTVMDLRGEPSGERRDSITYQIAAMDGSWTGIRWTEPGAEVDYLDHNGGRRTAPVIFGRFTSDAVSGGTLIVGTNDSLLLKRMDADSRVQRTQTLPWTPVAVNADWVEVERNRLLQEALDRSERWVRMGVVSRSTFDRARYHHANLPHRTSLPAFHDLQADASGNVWLAEYCPPGATHRTWVVLDALFEPIARISVPAELSILNIGDAYLAAGTQDELGRETVALYRIMR